MLGVKHLAACLRWAISLATILEEGSTSEVGCIANEECLCEGYTCTIPVTPTVRKLVCPAVTCCVWDPEYNIPFHVWGTDNYRSDSKVCLASRHAGVLHQNTTGLPERERTVYIELLGNIAEFYNSTRNGVPTLQYGLRTSAFRVFPPECPRGTYGYNCSLSCPGMCDCHHVTGECIDDCFPGWMPPSACNATCERQTFGPNCAGECFCVRDSACHHVFGPLENCTCYSGYWDAPNCKHKERAKVLHLSSQKVNPGQPSNITCRAFGGPPPPLSGFTMEFENRSVQEHLVYENITEVEVMGIADVVYGGETIFCEVGNDYGGISNPETNTTSTFTLPVLSSPPNVTYTEDATTVNVSFRSWIVGVDIGDEPIVKYRVCYGNVSADDPWYSEEMDHVTKAEITITLSGLTPDTNYNISVDVNREGEGGWGGCGKVTELKTSSREPINTSSFSMYTTSTAGLPEQSTTTHAPHTQSVPPSYSKSDLIAVGVGTGLGGIALGAVAVIVIIILRRRGSCQRTSKAAPHSGLDYDDTVVANQNLRTGNVEMRHTARATNSASITDRSPCYDKVVDVSDGYLVPRIVEDVEQPSKEQDEQYANLYNEVSTAEDNSAYLKLADSDVDND